MWSLLTSQLRYHAWWLIPAHLLIALIGLGFGFVDPADETSLDLWAALTIVGTVVMVVVHWGIEQRERRLLFWISLAVPLLRVQAARLLVAALLPATVTAMVFACITLSLGSVEPEGLRQIVSMQAFALTFIFLLHFSEEVNVRLAGREVLLYLFNFGLPAVLVWAMLGRFDPTGSPTMIYLWFAMAAALALTSLVLFRSRSTYLVGTDPCMSWKPAYWNEDEGS